MSAARAKPPAPRPAGAAKPAEAPAPPGPEPRDVVDGIPDRAARRPTWKYVLLASAFAAWVAVLVALYFVGRP